MSTSHVVIVDDAASMPELMGTGDSVLRELESSFPDVDILVRGNHISLTGDEVAVASYVSVPTTVEPSAAATRSHAVRMAVP